MGVLRIDSLEAVMKKFDRNPLEVAGFTSLLLDTGINDVDVLYKMVRRFLQTAIAEIHPDKTGENLTDKQQELMQAFEILKDQEMFTAALSELRQKHSIQRSDENMAKRESKDRASHIKRLEEELRQKSEISERIRIDLAEYGNKMLSTFAFSTANVHHFGWGDSIGFRHISGIDEAKLAFAIRVQASMTSTEFDQIKFEEFKSRFAALADEHKGSIPSDFHGRVLQFWADFRLSGMQSTRAKDLVTSTIKATSKKSLPIVQWNEMEAAKAYGFAKIGGYARTGHYRKRENGYLRTIEQMKAQVESFELFRSHYINCLRVLSESAFTNNPWVNQVELVPEIVELDRGYVGDSKIYGSIMAEEFYQRTVPKIRFTKEGFLDEYVYEDIVQHCHPVLLANSFMVEQGGKLSVKLTDRLTPESVRTLLLKVGNKKGYKFRSRRFIVGLL